MKAVAWRRVIGMLGASAAVVLAVWLVLALFAAVPAPEPWLLEQSGVRLLAELTVISLLVAAFGFWDE